MTTTDRKLYVLIFTDEPHFRGPFDDVEAAGRCGWQWRRAHNGDVRWTILSLTPDQVSKPLPVVAPEEA